LGGNRGGGGEGEKSQPTGAMATKKVGSRECQNRYAGRKADIQLIKKNSLFSRGQTQGGTGGWWDAKTTPEVTEGRNPGKQGEKGEGVGVALPPRRKGGGGKKEKGVETIRKSIAMFGTTQ